MLNTSVWIEIFGKKSLNVIGIFLLIWKKVSQSSIKKENFNLKFFLSSHKLKDKQPHVASGYRIGWN